MADLKIATKAFCNTLKSGAFSGDTTQCPTKSMIESAGLTVTGSFESNQLVPEDNISYLVWEYTFSVTPTSYTIPAGGGSKQFTVTSYKIQYSTSTAGSHIEVPGSKQNVGYTSSNSTTSSGITWTSSSNTLTGANNTSTSGKSGTITWTQNESSKKVSANYTQTAGGKTYSAITITSATVSDIPAAGGSISTGNVSFSQTWGWNGATTGGGTLTGNTSTPNGASISWSPTVSAASKGTTQSGRTSTGKTITASVTWNGKSATKAVTVYQAANNIESSSTSWNNWVYTVTVSANPTTIAYSGGTSSITSSGSGTRTGTITHTWSSGSKSTESTSGTTSGNPTLSTNLGSLSSTTSPSILTLPANTGAERSATVTATWNGVSKTVAVTQDAGVVGYNYYISISPSSSVNHSASGGDSTEFTISSYKIKTINGVPTGGNIDCNWTASISSSTGFTLSSSSGSNSGKTTVSSKLNESATSDRSTTLTVKNSENTSKTASVTITQSKSTYIFLIKKSEDSDYGTSVTLDYSAKEPVHYSVDIRTSRNGDTLMDYTVASDSSWISVTKNSPSGLKWSVEENKTTSSRSGTITLTQDYTGNKVYMYINQAAGSITYRYTLSADKASISFSTGGGTIPITISSYKTTIINGVSQGDVIPVSISSVGFTGTDREKFTSRLSGTEQQGSVLHYNIIADPNPLTRELSATLGVSNGGYSTDLKVPITQGKTSKFIIGGANTLQSYTI